MTPTTMRPDSAECSPYYHGYIALVPDGDIIQTLTDQHQHIHTLLDDLSDEQAERRPAPGEWSIKEVVQHVIDAERLFAFRALWFARGEQADLPGMEPDPWVAHTDANARSLADLLAEFELVRKTTIHLLQNLDAAAWDRAGIASGASMSVRALAWIIAGHELHHNQSLTDVYL